jgi:YegS/Rv2252/BmrU family lipid kinase
MTHRAAVILNPISGRGRGLRLKEKLIRHLESAGYAVDLFVTGATQDAMSLAATIGTAHHLVVVVGGDGTVNEVVNGLKVDVPIGVVPLGTENLLARQCGVSRSFRQACDTLLHGVPQRVDAGLANGRRFLLMAGIGIDADIVGRLQQQRRGPITRLTYALPAIRAISTYRSPRIQVALDGGATTWAYFVVVGNSKHYGGRLRLTPDAVPDDGWLDVLLLRRRRLHELLSCGIHALAGNLRSLQGVEYVRCRKLVARCDEPAPYQIDGEFGGHLPLEIGIQEKAVTLLVRRKTKPR